MTNRQFALSDYHFIKACNEVGIKPTIRQASKWRRRKGKAWKDYVGLVLGLARRMLRSNFERSTEGR